MPSVSMVVLGECITQKELDPKWRIFPSMLRARNISVVPIGDTSATHFFALEHDDKSLRKIDSIVDVSNRVLVIVEPKTVHPAQHTKKVLDQYGKIVALSHRHLIHKPGEIWFGGHLDTPSKVIADVKTSANIYRNTESIGMINENKFSLISESLYKKRYLVVKEFIERSQEFQLAGKNWEKGYLWTIAKNIHAGLIALRSQNRPDLKRLYRPLDLGNPNIKYHGRVRSQLEFLRTLKFAVVIENEASYVTEKLLNAIIAGCVPIYLGPPLFEFGIPDDVAIQVNGFGASFYDAFKFSTDDQVNSVLNSGRNWITSTDTLHRWGVLAGFERLASRIKELSTE